MRYNKTFSMIPDAGVIETLTWKTDVLISRNGSESRFSLRDLPRKNISASFSVVDGKAREEFVQLLSSKVKEVYVCPEWSYFSTVDQFAAQGTRRLRFNKSTIDLTVGRPVAVFNTNTRQVQINYVTEIKVDGAEFLEFFEEDVPVNAIICTASEFLLEDASSLSWASVSGSASVSLNSWKEYPLIRDEGVVTLPTFDGLLVLDKRPNNEISTSFSFEKSIIDNQTGARAIYSNEDFSRINDNRKYTFSRYFNPEVMDYFRNFFDTIKGSWKSFLISSFTPDFRLTRTPVSGSSNIYVRGDDKLKSMFEQNAYSRIHVQYADGTSSYHKIIASSVALEGEISVLLSPSLPVDPKVANVQSISTLLRATMSDIVKLTHQSLETTIEISIRSVNE